jgi:hypothetical protein
MTTATDTILAIDLGRYKSVACVYQRSSREHSFRTFDTTPAELTKLLARHPGSLVVTQGHGSGASVEKASRPSGHGPLNANRTIRQCATKIL